MLWPKASSNADSDISGHQTTSLMANGAQGLVMLNILTKKNKKFEDQMLYLPIPCHTKSESSAIAAQCCS